MIQFDEHIFQMGWFNHQLVYYYMRVEDILLETNSSHLKIDGWKLKFLLKWPIFRRELLGLGSVYNRVSSLPIFVVPLDDEKTCREGEDCSIKRSKCCRTSSTVYGGKWHPTISTGPRVLVCTPLLLVVITACKFKSHSPAENRQCPKRKPHRLPSVSGGD